VELCLCQGEEYGVNLAEDLLAEHQPKAEIADEGCGADELVTRICQRGAQAAIPPRSNRKQPRKLSKRRYNSRNLMERFVNRIKHGSAWIWRSGDCLSLRPLPSLLWI
jgi:hypothetical protein